MRTIGTQALLDAWEVGHTQAPQRWALTVLALAEPEQSLDALAHFSIGQRDAGLLTWRCSVFGHQLGVIEQCPRCGEQLEVDLDAADLLLPVSERPAAEFDLQTEACNVRFRLPNSLDLMAVADCPDAARAEALLVDRCVVEARRGADQIAGSDLPTSVVDALSERMAELDPQSDLRLSLRCAACRHDWTVVFDILPFLWRELDALALRVLHEVHRLASAYGWAEADILSMSAPRRRHYLAMLGA